MKKVIFGVFAHPDDEAFGASATLVKEIEENSADVHLVTFTYGEAGMNPDDVADLATTRRDEWHAAGKLIGASSMHYLRYKDGTLSNNIFLEAAARLEDIIRSVAADYDEPTIEMISIDTNGVTGHIDHIVASRVAHYVYYKLRDILNITRLRLNALPRTNDEPNIDFVYMEPGRTEDEISEVIDARQYVDRVYAIMCAHKSQRADGEAHIRNKGENVAVNYFVTIES